VILSVKYIKVEAIARELISAATTKTINKKKNKLEYLFY